MMRVRWGYFVRSALWTWPPVITILYLSDLRAATLAWIGAGVVGWTLVLCEFLTRRIRQLTTLLDELKAGRNERRLPNNMRSTPGRIARTVNDLLDHIDATRHELASQREFHETTVRQLPDPLVITDRERIIMVANPAAERAFRAAPGELVGESVRTLYRDEEDFVQAGEEFAHQSPNANPEPILTYLRRRDHSTFPAELTRAVVRDDAGKVVNYVGHVRDISRRRRKEQAHAQQHEILEKIVRGDTYERILSEIAATAQTYDMTLRCGLFSLDADGTTFNALETSSVPTALLETLSACHCLDTAHTYEPNDPGQVFIRESLAENEDTGALAQALEAAGFALVSIHPMRGFDGETLGALATFYTDADQFQEAGADQARAIANLAGIALGYRRRERELSEQQTALRLLKRSAIVANTADSVSDALRACAFEVTDLLGFEFAHVNILDRELLDEGELGTWVTVDPAVAPLESELRRLPPMAVSRELSHTPEWVDDLGAALTPEWSAALARAQLTHGLLMPLGNSGAPTAVLEFYARHSVATAHLVEVMPSVAEQLNIVIARKRAEATLVAARDASDQAAQAKSDFLANMSHEIRTPMNGVIGMTALLAESDLTQEQSEWVDTVKTSSEALLGIINDILDFSKVEAGKLSLEPLQFELRDLVNNVVDLLQPWANDKSIALDARFDTDAPTALIGDPGRIRQVVTNLVNNAVKFTQKGRVLIKVDDIGSSADQARLKISVVDTGPGIPREALRGLFEKFVQADGSTTRRFGGTGLGLAISKQLAELMGGDIGVESTENVGSTFWFTLNLPARHERHGTNPGFSGTRVVVVKDEQAQTRQLIDLMYRWSLSVSEADSVARAVTLLEQGKAVGNPFQIVLLQRNDPNSIDALRAPCARTQTALVVVTGDDPSCLPGVHTLTPPVEQSHLLDMIATVWESLPSESPAFANPANEAEPLGGASQPHDDDGPLLRVLVVEDNLVNQKVAVGMLRRLGCEVEVAANGLRALDALERETFDLVFMDCQMPEMDGYAATAEIRRREAAGSWQTWQGRLPIVAMTANALQGDREKCLDAGMDDYVSKPAKTETLDEMLTRWVRSVSQLALPAAVGMSGEDIRWNLPYPTSANEPAPRVSATESPLDMAIFDELRDVVGDGLPSIVSGFLEDTPRCLDSIGNGVAQKRPDTVAALAHQLKSSSASLGAQRLSALTRRLEEAAQANDIDSARTIVGEAVEEFRRVNDALLAQVPHASGGTDRQVVA